MRARLYLLAAYIYNVACAVDQLVNALRGGAADSTVSADAWHAWELDPTERRNAPKHMAKRALEGGEWVI